MKCINCGRDRPQESGTVFKLTDQERAIIEKVAGEPPPIELFYCAPCYRVVTDREMGARLISGQLEIRLRLAGHPKAKQAAEAFYKLLISKSVAKQVS